MNTNFPMSRKPILPTRSNIPPSSRSLLQRKCACGGTSASNGECEECKKKELQRKESNSSAGTANGDQVPQIVHEVLRSPGQPLDPATRAFMEPRFGHDFGNVRLHTDGKAAASARSVNALAYTSGRHIIFGQGQYAPAAASGRELLAHELAHTVQQRNVSGLPASVSLPGDPLERAAERTAYSALRSPDPTTAADGGRSPVTPVVARRVAGVNCAANQFGAPEDPQKNLKTVDEIAIDLTTKMAADLATDSQTALNGIPDSPSDSLQSYQNHFGVPVPTGAGFLNRLTGVVRPTQEIALSEEIAIVSRRFAGVGRLMSQGLSYNCPGSRDLSLVGCTAGSCASGDAFSCPGNSLVALCQTFWANYDDIARAQILIHEGLHIALGNIGIGNILDATTRGPGRNFNIAGCYEALLADRTGADSKAACPGVP